MIPEQWVQGELVGPGIQANPLSLSEQRLVVFGFGTFIEGDRASFVRAPFEYWPHWVKKMAVKSYDFTLPDTIQGAVDQVEKLISLLSPGKDAEGVVWTHAYGIGHSGLENRAVFKSISAKYLLKHS
jgi:hypothetical protein